MSAIEAAAAAAGSGSTSSWLAAAGPGWAPADSSAEDAGSGAYSPGMCIPAHYLEQCMSAACKSFSHKPCIEANSQAALIKCTRGSALQTHQMQARISSIADGSLVYAVVGRAETLSPSRGERLAFLKRRQVEKRAVSATGSVRGSNPWDSQDGALAAAAAAQAPTGMGAMDGPRAATAGPASAVALGWRLSNSTESPIGAGLAQTGYSPSGSPAPGEDSSLGLNTGSSSGRGGHGALLQWHIPTGPGGRVLPPGSSGAAQQQRQHSSSPEPGSVASRAQGSYSPSNSWDNSSSSLSAGRAFQSSTGSAPVTGSPHAGQLLQTVSRTVSAAAVLVHTGADSYSGSANADSSGSASTSGVGYRSSRFQQVRSGSSSPAPPGSSEGATQGGGLPLGSSRLHGSSAGGSAGFGRQQQAQPTQQQQQQSLGSRAQTAAAALGARGPGSGDWGTGTSSSPASQMVSASGPNGSGCFASSSGASGMVSASLTGAGSPTRSPGGVGSRGGGLRGLMSGDRPQSSGVAEVDLAGAELAPLQDPEAGLR